MMNDFPTCLAPLTKRHSFFLLFFQASNSSYIFLLNIFHLSLHFITFYHIIQAQCIEFDDTFAEKCIEFDDTFCKMCIEFDDTF